MDRNYTYEVFISFKNSNKDGSLTKESAIAARLDEYLGKKGLRVFFSKRELEFRGQGQYSPAIDNALETSRFLIAVGCSPENLESKWVRYEWDSFLNSIRSGVKANGEVYVLYEDIDINDLPWALRQQQAFNAAEGNAFEQISNFIQNALSYNENDHLQPKAKGGSQTEPENSLSKARNPTPSGPSNKTSINKGKFAAAAFIIFALLAGGLVYYRLALQSPAPILTSEQPQSEPQQAEQQQTAVPILADEAFKTAIEEKTDKPFAWRDISSGILSRVIAAGADRIIGLRADGSVVIAGSTEGSSKNALGWKDIVAISAMNRNIVGLRGDGTVVGVGSGTYMYDYMGNAMRIGNWRDIIAIAAGIEYIIGLRSDGTVAAEGHYQDSNLGTLAGYGLPDDGAIFAKGGSLLDWKDIAAIATGGSRDYNHTVGLRWDGLVAAAGSNGEKQCDVLDWKNIVAVAAGDAHTVGLRSDGTVVATGNNDRNQCDVSGWRDIIAIAAAGSHTVGLQADGTVVAVGGNRDKQCEVSDWEDIIAIAAGWDQTVGLRKDGTVVVAGRSLDDNDTDGLNIDWRTIAMEQADRIKMSVTVE